MRRRTFCAYGLASTLASKAALSAMENPAVTDYRPQIHYSPQTGFMNDPNGLVFHDGEYHLFYQYNPFGSRHARMHWVHTVSRDLLRWTNLPIPLKAAANR